MKYSGIFCFLACGIIAFVQADDSVYWGPQPDDLRQRVEMFIAGAQQRLCIAAYRLSAASIVSALIAAQRRGVTVRVVLDKSALKEPVCAAASKRLERASIPVWWGGGDGLMHHKYCIADDVVMTGSANLTRAGLQRNYEIIGTLHAPSVVQAYVTHFEVLTRRCAGLSAALPRCDDTVFFMPDQGRLLRQVLCAQIQEARHEIMLSLYAFTASWCIEALIQAARRGVVVSVLVEGQQLGNGDRYARLRSAGVRVLVHQSSQCILHHKIVIIDDAVWFGSLNMTGAAFARNNEDMVLNRRLASRLAFREQLLQVMQAVG